MDSWVEHSGEDEVQELVEGEKEQLLQGKETEP